MQRKRGELVPVAEALADLGGPVQALRKTPPPALHHFTQADQVNLLVGASEATPDLGFMARERVGKFHGKAPCRAAFHRRSIACSTD